VAKNLLREQARKHGTPLVLVDHDVISRNYALAQPLSPDAVRCSADTGIDMDQLRPSFW
jgi:hypothetical protein